MCRHVVTLSKKNITCIFNYSVCSRLPVCVCACLISTNCSVFISGTGYAVMTLLFAFKML